MALYLDSLFYRPFSNASNATSFRLRLCSATSSPPARRPLTFGLREPLPAIPVPLAPGEAEPELRLNEVLHALYERARFDLRLRYDRPPAPALGEEDAVWARELTGAGAD